MKSTTKDTAVSVTAYHNTDVADLIAETSVELTNTAKEKAEELAEQGLPKQGEEDLNMYISWLTAACNVLKSKVATKLNLSGLKSKGAALLSRFKKREEELTKKTTELSSRKRDLKKEVDKINAEDALEEIKRWRIVHPVIIALIFSECIALEQVMATLSSAGFILRMIVALAICLCTYFFAKSHVINTRKVKGTWKYIPLHLVYFASVSTIFYFFGEMRMSYLNSMNPEMAERTNSIIFLIVSLTFYAGCAVAKMIYMPSKEDRMRALNYTKKRKELIEMEKALETAQKELQDLPEERERALYEVFSLLKMSEHYLDQVNHSYEGIVGDFVLTNTIARHDGAVISVANFKGGVIPPLEEFQITTQEL
ncbi:MAG: hypothetical protein NXI10_03595 [bacterium]|nr:hypothetical protein [bacterium]